MSVTVANTLYNRGNKIIREGETGKVEIRFYSSETPNEKFRIGQKTLIGRVTDIDKINDGYSFTFDLSEKYFGKTNTFQINKLYIEACYIRCILFDITNTINDIEESVLMNGYLPIHISIKVLLIQVLSNGRMRPNNM